MPRFDRPVAALSGHSVAALAVACGFAVANLYYSQPLLPSMAATFGAGAAAQGMIAMLTQLGYAVGLLLFGPLGDRVDRHRLITALLAANVAGLALCATAPSLHVLLLATVVVGLTTVSAQIIIPAASGMVDPGRRGHVVGRLMSGLFAGVLLGRIASGYVGAHAGWRAMFGVATVVDLAMIVLIWRWLPRVPPASDLSYPRLLASLVQLFVRQPLLREACLSGFLVFAAFNVLWGALAMMLARAPYHWGSEVAGLFGLAGVAGIVASPAMGRLADRRGGRRVAVLASAVVAVAFALLAGSVNWVACLLVGVLVLDLGSRANLVANQTRLYTLLPQARGRLNTVFMTVYFVGGATGSALGAAVGGRFGWTGLAVAGIGCAALAVATGLHRSKMGAICSDDHPLVGG